MTEVSSPATFQPRSNLQMNGAQLPQMQYTSEAQFNLPSPHMIHSKSSNSAFNNLSKYGNQNVFAGQQMIDENAFN